MISQGSPPPLLRSSARPPPSAMVWGVGWVNFYGFYMTHDGSMVLLYMVCHGSHQYSQYTPFMLAYIPAPWIRHGWCFIILPWVYIIMFFHRRNTAHSCGQTTRKPCQGDPSSRLPLCLAALVLLVSEVPQGTRQVLAVLLSLARSCQLIHVFQNGICCTPKKNAMFMGNMM